MYTATLFERNDTMTQPKKQVRPPTEMVNLRPHFLARKGANERQLTAIPIVTMFKPREMNMLHFAG
jgi:hypothetical protein